MEARMGRDSRSEARCAARQRDGGTPGRTVIAGESSDESLREIPAPSAPKIFQTLSGKLATCRVFSSSGSAKTCASLVRMKFRDTVWDFSMTDSCKGPEASGIKARGEACEPDSRHGVDQCSSPLWGLTIARTVSLISCRSCPAASCATSTSNSSIHLYTLPSHDPTCSCRRSTSA